MCLQIRPVFVLRVKSIPFQQRVPPTRAGLLLRRATGGRVGGSSWRFVAAPRAASAARDEEKRRVGTTRSATAAVPNPVGENSGRQNSCMSTMPPTNFFRDLGNDLARTRRHHCRHRGPPPRPPNGIEGYIVEVGRANDVSLGGGVIERCRQPGTRRVDVAHHRLTFRPALLFQRTQMFVFKNGTQKRICKGYISQG